MKADTSERLDNLEDEVRVLDSAIDARTRELWTEITKLRAIIEELKAAQTRREK
ncbi:hypothetical protein SAMN04488082_1373 [Desulfomicrobium apsheronum]|uniref:Uncharacterized protein n=1 Tax=Desulfomicrobium apsheronum TaxID=52560 RepID=A0A1I4AEK1_9BACT|nr:hypothetical protein [Desulfomicrobium apsheronum]SFK54872.1 hypothetical protein SAMN04488082_1373 [Desulfomicrobium apsheronum]